MVLFLQVLACTAETGEDSADLAGGTAAAPRHPAAEFTADDVAAQLMERVKFGAPSTPVLIETFSSMLREGDEHCPGGGYLEQGLEYYPPAGCTADSGYWYQGVGGAGYGWVDLDWDGKVDGYLEAMKVDGAMADPQGNVFVFGGTVSFELTGDPVDGGTFEAGFLGTYEYPGSTTQWLKSGVSTGYYLEGTIDSSGRWAFEANGGFAVDGQAMSMAGFTVNGACGTKPTGTVSVRDQLGYWYDLTYDETSCDGCGEVSFDGTEPLGRACADITPGLMTLTLEISANMDRALEHL